MEVKNYKKFQNTACEYFPCHKVEENETFNCLFCYCPLYMMEDKCGGNFIYLDSGIKSCQNCTKPHDANGYDYIQEKMAMVIEKVKKKKE